MSAPLLQLENVSRHFGGVAAVEDVTFSLFENEVVGLIGPNGAGKTTLVNLITGVHGVTAGRIAFLGRRIDGLKTHQISTLGIARTFQVVQPFPAMSVLDNVAAAALFAGGAGGVRDGRAAAMEHLSFVGLDAKASNLASALSLPERKRLELAKSLAMNPRVLLLDEVNAGLNAREIDQALELINRLAARGITILIIEHLMKVVINLCQRVVVLHHGELIAEGEPGDVVQRPAVVEAYLGSRYAERLRKAAAR